MVLVAVQWLLWFVIPLFFPGTMMLALIGAAAGGLGVLVWWFFFSRLPWSERLGVVALMVASVVVLQRIVHPSIANAMMGMMLPIYSVPVFCLALVGAAAAARRQAPGPRRLILGLAILAASGTFALLRTGGITGEGDADLHWRWQQSPEERLLAHGSAAASTGTKTPGPSVAVQPSSWPGFRGAQRDAAVRGTALTWDGPSTAPTALWRRPVGPGWSSFAVEGDLLYTQEQRGEEEVVACYRLTTGEPVWSHGDRVRFWESNAGAGPRGTPLLHQGKVFACGATGLVNALDARTGAVVWSRRAADDTGQKIPDWGFAGSPLAAGDLVIVATAGVVAAYDAAKGNLRWVGPKGGWGYSSPHAATLDGVPQILFCNGQGVLALAPVDGALLWQHAWKSDGIAQPALLPDGDILLGSGSGLGTKSGVLRLAVTRRGGKWTSEERWSSLVVKPYYNDLVVHRGHVYGFDGSRLACLELDAGERRWKGGRYGHGQILLLADQDLLLVLSESGEVALVKAVPDAFVELARIPAIQGKTWNHPVLAGDVLLVRNSEEMAAFRFASSSRRP